MIEDAVMAGGHRRGASRRSKIAIPASTGWYARRRWGPPSTSSWKTWTGSRRRSCPPSARPKSPPRRNENVL